MYDSAMAVLVVTDDLFFASKIEAVAAQLGVSLRLIPDLSRTAEVFGCAPYRLAIVDLNASKGASLDAVQEIRRRDPQLPILGFCSHVQLKLQEQAKSAGCTEVVPRSVFARQLPSFLTGKWQSALE